MSDGNNLRPGDAGAPLSGQPNRNARWVKIVLALSLAINLAVLGMFIGAFFHSRDNPRPPTGAQAPEAKVLRELGLGPFLTAFEPADRKRMARLMRERVGSLQGNREVLADELNSILEAVKAVPFDPVQLEAVLDRQKARVTTRAEAGRDVLLQAIGDMSDEERATFAKRMERSISRAIDRARDHSRDHGRP